MPQFDTFTFFSQLFWVFTFFFFSFISFSYYLLPAISIVLKVRRKKQTDVTLLEDSLTQISLIFTPFFKSLQGNFSLTNVQPELQGNTKDLGVSRISGTALKTSVNEALQESFCFQIIAYIISVRTRNEEHQKAAEISAPKQEPTKSTKKKKKTTPGK